MKKSAGDVVCLRGEILGRSLRWTEEELECEASEERHQVLLRYFGVDEESKMVSRAALKSEEIDGAEELNSLEAAEAKTPCIAFEWFHLCVQQRRTARRWREQL